MLALEKKMVNLNVEAEQELPSTYCGIVSRTKNNDYSKVVISRVDEIIKAKNETWKNIEKEIGIEKLWNKVHSNPKRSTMQKIADYIVNEGAISVSELNSVDTDLWRKAVISFGAQVLASEMQMLSRYLLGGTA